MKVSEALAGLSRMQGDCKLYLRDEDGDVFTVKDMTLKILPEGGAANDVETVSIIELKKSDKNLPS